MKGADMLAVFPFTSMVDLNVKMRLELKGNIKRIMHHLQRTANSASTESTPPAHPDGFSGQRWRTLTCLHHVWTLKNLLGKFLVIGTPAGSQGSVIIAYGNPPKEPRQPNKSSLGLEDMLHRSSVSSNQSKNRSHMTLEHHCSSTRLDPDRLDQTSHICSYLCHTKQGYWRSERIIWDNLNASFLTHTHTQTHALAACDTAKKNTLALLWPTLLAKLSACMTLFLQQKAWSPAGALGLLFLLQTSTESAVSERKHSWTSNRKNEGSFHKKHLGTFKLSFRLIWNAY